MPSENFEKAVRYIEGIGVNNFIPDDATRFDAIDAVILWGKGLTAEEIYTENVHVVFSPRGSGKHNSHEYELLPSSWGNIESDWMEDEWSNPEVVTKVDRNDPCPYGSGKKFKKCGGAN